MAGRRLRDTVRDVIRGSGVIPVSEEIYVTIAGLANGYSSYVTTFEEYQAQRYEAASTVRVFISFHDLQSLHDLMTSLDIRPVHSRWIFARVH